MRRENQIFDFIRKGSPFIVSAILAIIAYKVNFVTTDSKGLDTLFSNLINIFAIIVGVLIALFGILPSISNSPIMERIRKYDAENELFYFCKETLNLNFLSLFVTIVISFLNSNYVLYNCIFSIWLFIICSTLISSYRTVIALLRISFLSSKQLKNSKINKLDKSKSKKLEDKYVEKEKNND